MSQKDNRPVTLAGLRSRGRGKLQGASALARQDKAADAPQLGLLFSDGRTEAEVEAPLVVPEPRRPMAAAANQVSLSPSPHLMPPQPMPTARTTGGERNLVPPKMEVTLSPVQGAPAGSSMRTAERRVWTVRGILSDLRQRVEGGYGEVWVEGEISNCRPAASGHLYLTLRDGEAQLPVVLFRRQAQLLRFRPTTGMAVLVRGRLSVYEDRGELQLIGETLEPRGAGALLLAFEQLKARLAAEGLFAAARKRALPPFPRCVGVITSTSGAVLHDIVTVVRRRHARLNLLVYPALVQGPGCAASVAAGIRWFNQNRDKAELILVARGGGAPEDLAGFNDEALARAIAASELPVISAVGHETDFTIADFVADLRAPTPSAAAEIMTQSQHRIEERLEALERRLRRGSGYRLLEARQRFARMSAEHVLRRVQQGIDRRQQRLDETERRMARAAERAGANRLRQLEDLRRRLERQDVARRLARGAERLQGMEQRLVQAGPGLLARRRAQMERVAARLEAMSPLAVLKRGYALLYNVEGTTGEAGGLITSSTDTRPGQRVRARLAQGSLTAEVTEIETQ